MLSGREQAWLVLRVLDVAEAWQGGCLRLLCNNVSFLAFSVRARPNMAADGLNAEGLAETAIHEL